MKIVLLKFLIIPKIALILSLPVLILLTNLHIVTSSLWLKYEYNKLFTFPADYHNYTDSRRLELAETTLHYMRSEEDADFLRNLKIEGSPIYSEREIAHLVEVKSLIQKLGDMNLIIFISALLSVLILWQNRRTRPKIPLFVLKGCLLLVVFFGVLLIASYVNWNKLFLILHRIFFPDGNYSFTYSFTITQLFPPRFWFDTVLVWQILALIETLILAGCMFWIRKKTSVKRNIK